MSVFEYERLSQTSRTEEEWLKNCADVATRYEKMAEENESSGNTTTAGMYYVSAALYYHFGHYLYYRNLERKRSMAKKSASAYAKGAPGLVPAAERVELPLHGGKIVGYFKKPLGQTKGLPCVILLPGLEATKEEINTLGDAFLQRNNATFTLDGPGQGESWEHLQLDESYHQAVSKVADYLDGRKDLREKCYGIVGVSMGGLLAPLSAAYEKRIRACSGIAGPFEITRDFWQAKNPLTRLGYQYVTHSGSEEEAFQKASKLSIAHLAKDITIPTLIVHGQQDKIVPVEHAHRFETQLPNCKLIIFQNGNHVCHNIADICRPLVADWISSQLRRTF